MRAASLPLNTGCRFRIAVGETVEPLYAYFLEIPITPGRIDSAEDQLAPRPPEWAKVSQSHSARNAVGVLQQPDTPPRVCGRGSRQEGSQGSDAYNGRIMVHATVGLVLQYRLVSSIIIAKPSVLIKRAGGYNRCLLLRA